LFRVQRESLPLRHLAQGWFDGAGEKSGSWWPDWDSWMKSHSAGMIPAPAKLGNMQYSPIEAAPGRYVKEKAN
jgi:polyhydroxyalkanoate synthase